MGTNKRYAHRIDQQMDRRIEESAMRPKIESLPPAVTGIDHDKPVKAPEPIEVEAWVPISSGTVKIQARVVEWNTKAAHIEWRDSSGNERAAWVYLGAVKRR
ncbi:hypothetical protein [Herbiconiux sp. YIM B11900]|uniref:hypothetical protein n=1 Tax=Herbiconiux sp. YIM B11900 TaxID=3404131 RepID=UPI003F834252